MYSSLMAQVEKKLEKRVSSFPCLGSDEDRRKAEQRPISIKRGSFQPR